MRFVYKIFKRNGLSKAFLKGNDLLTFITNIETLIIKSKFVYDIEYRPKGEYFVIRIGYKLD